MPLFDCFRCARCASKVRSKQVPKRLLGLAVISLVLGLSGCVTNPVSGGRDFVLMSEQQEISMGKQSHEAIIKQYGVYDAPELAAMINRIGKQLAQQSHRPHLNYTFTLLDSPEVNAFALPGGYIYITRGIMAYMNSEEELAGVLGHELGHVTARHSVKQHSATQAKGLLTLLVAAASNSNKVTQALSTAGSALVKGYGRNHELEADRLGAEYLAKTGYDPESMLEVIGILKDQESFAKAQSGKTGEPAVAYHGLFSSHPSNDKRLQEVVMAAKKFAVPNAPRKDIEAFVRSEHDMIFGDSEAQGIVQKNRFYHKDFDLYLAFPNDWKLQNNPDNLIGISPKRTELIQMRLGDSKAETQPAAFLRKAFADIKAVQTLGDGRVMGLAEIETPWGKKIARVAAIKHKQHTLVLLAAGQSRTPEQGFISTVKSVRPLTRADQKHAIAKRIKVVRVQPGQSYAGLARQSSLGDAAEAQLRLLNGQYPKGELQAGQLIKIVE